MQPTSLHLSVWRHSKDLSRLSRTFKACMSLRVCPRWKSLKTRGIRTRRPSIYIIIRGKQIAITTVLYKTYLRRYTNTCAEGRFYPKVLLQRIIDETGKSFGEKDGRSFRRAPIALFRETGRTSNVIRIARPFSVRARVCVCTVYVQYCVRSGRRR